MFNKILTPNYNFVKNKQKQYAYPTQVKAHVASIYIKSG